MGMYSENCWENLKNSTFPLFSINIWALFDASPRDFIPMPLLELHPYNRVDEAAEVQPLHSSFNLCLQSRLCGICIQMIEKKNPNKSAFLQSWFILLAISVLLSLQSNEAFPSLKPELRNTQMRRCANFSCSPLSSFEIISLELPSLKTADDFKQPSELSRGICKMFSPRKSKAGDLCFSNPMINKDLWLKIYIYINIGTMLKSCHAWLAVWREFWGVLQSLFIFPDLAEKKALRGGFVHRGAASPRAAGVGMVRCWSGCWPWYLLWVHHPQQGNASATES